MSPDRNLRVLVVDDHDVVHWLTPVSDEEYAAAPSLSD